MRGLSLYLPLWDRAFVSISSGGRREEPAGRLILASGPVLACTRHPGAHEVWKELHALCALPALHGVQCGRCGWYMHCVR